MAPSASPRTSIRGVMSSFPAEMQNSFNNSKQAFYFSLSNHPQIFLILDFQKLVHFFNTLPGFLFINSSSKSSQELSPPSQLPAHISLCPLDSPQLSEHGSFCTLTVSLHLLLFPFWNPSGIGRNMIAIKLLSFGFSRMLLFSNHPGKMPSKPASLRV